MGLGLRNRVAVGALAACLLTPVAVILGTSPAFAANGVVSDGGDTGLATQLRQVVAAAAPNDIITFTVPTVTLTQGEILINKDLTIRGNGPGATILTRSGQSPAPSRILHVAPSVTANVDLLTVSGGASPMGAGIYVEGTLNLSRSTIANNTASDPNAAAGGGIAASAGASLTITNSTISGNTATSPGGGFTLGGGIAGSGGPITITGSSVTGNTATSTVGFGGAGGISGGLGTSTNLLSVTDSIVYGNTASTAGTNPQTAAAEAGGIGSAQPVTVTNSIVQNNKASGTPTVLVLGGGIVSNSALTMDRTEVTDNQATGASLSVGGGIAVLGTTTVTNSTFNNNSAADGSAVATAGIGAVSTTLSFVTVAGNPSAGAALSNGSGTFTLNNSIVSNSGVVVNNCMGTITQTGTNDVFGTPGTCAGAAFTADPLLGGPAASGGINRTMAITSALSPAVNSAAGCPASGVDQRGFLRPASACDLGAYEFGATLPDTTPPACAMVGVLATNPKQQDVSVTDTVRGLQAITNIAATNGTVIVPFFLPGTTQPVKLAAVKTVQTSPTSWSFDAVDQALNSKHCK